MLVGGVAAIALATLEACRPPAESGHTSPITSAAATVAQAAAAVTGQEAKLAEEVTGGKYLGFDTYTYPGDATMRTWKNTPGAKYRWVGFYLPAAPCHRSSSWSGKAPVLREMGWGLAVVYVGQQTWGREPRKRAPKELAQMKAKSSCNADFITAEQGLIDGDDAIRKAKAEGFARGTVIYLDIERMEKVPPVMREYYRAWTKRVLQEGTYRAGVYVHAHNAELVFADVSAVYKVAGRTDEPRFWVAGGKGFNEGRAPQDVGFAFAGVWQGIIDVARSVGNVRLPVDVNVAAWPSPSD